MRIVSAANISPIQTTSNISSETRNIAQDVQATTKTSTQRDSYNYQELSQKTKYELSIDESIWIGMIQRANKAIAGSTCNFEYSIHEGTKEIMVKVIDQDTKEVIREIPPEKILDMVAKMWEMAGILVDERR